MVPSPQIVINLSIEKKNHTGPAISDILDTDIHMHAHFLLLLFKDNTYGGGRGHWAVYYNSPLSHMITFSNSLAQQPWGLLLNFDWLVYLAKCPNDSTPNFNLQKW